MIGMSGIGFLHCIYTNEAMGSQSQIIGGCLRQDCYDQIIFVCALMIFSVLVYR